MLYVMWRFSEKRNPTPSRTTHNTTLEVLWTVIPVLILVAIAIPSFKLLYLPVHVPAAGSHDQGHRPCLELDARVSRPGHQRRFGHAAGQRAPGADQVGHPRRAGAAQPRGRQRDPGSRQQGGARAGHLQRRDPQLDHSLVRVQGRRRARPRYGDVVQGRRRKASTSASARSCAARTTPSCRSPCAS